MNKLYDLEKKVMIRSPLLSLNEYVQLFEHENYDLMVRKIKEDKINEMILVASKNLFLNIHRKMELEKKIPEDILLSCIKYMIRSSTRCTPFGICAGVSCGFLNETSEIQLDFEQSNNKFARPDMEWLLAVVKKMENDRTILKELKVRFNYLCLSKGQRIVNSYCSSDGKMTSIRNTEMVEFVQSCTQNFIHYRVLQKEIENKRPEIPIEVIDNFLFDLVNNEILLTELRPPLVNTVPLQYLINKCNSINKCKKWEESLSEIKSLFDQYNKTCIGEGITIYQEIEDNLKSFVETANYIQVDMKKSAFKCLIGQNVQNEVKNAINILCRLADYDGKYKYLKEYKNKFIERYGYNTVVPLKEMLDEDMGIGLPKEYQGSLASVSNNGLALSKWDIFLRKEIQNAVKFGYDEIQLTDEKLSPFITKAVSIEHLPFSFDIFFELVSNSLECINKSDFRLVFTGAKLSCGAGKTMGRFARLFSEYNVGEISDKLDVYPENVEVVEMSEYPKKARTANVALCESKCKYHLGLGTPTSNLKELNISDIYIGIDNSNNFYIKSEKLNKKLIVENHTMVNAAMGCNESRFLKDISATNSYPIYNVLNSFEINDLIYVPRIVYGKIVMKSASWCIDHEIFRMGEKNLHTFLQNWKVPEHVYLESGDNKLLLNLKNSFHFKILFDIGKKEKNKVKLVESYTFNENTWLKDQKGESYLNELVFQAYREKNTEKNETLLLSSLRTQNHIHDFVYDLHDKKMNFYFGEDGWIYLKLYYNTDLVDELIGKYIKIFCDHLLKKRIIRKYFYIRYADPQKHVRLRIQYFNYETHISELMQWIMSLKEKEYIYDLQFDTYQREYARYGGFSLIEYAEDFFCKDSILIGQFLDDSSMNDEIEFGMINILSIITAFGVSNDDATMWLTYNIGKNKYRIEYRKEREKYIDIVSSFYNNRYLQKYAYLCKPLANRDTALAVYRARLEQMDCENGLSNSKESILSSLIHMSCNRIRGDNIWENMVRALTRNAIYEYYQRKKHIGEKKT